MANEKLFIARWYGNKEAAVSLRFDDSCKTHVRHAVPILNRFDIKGTFMVNPGRRAYQQEKTFWEKSLLAMGHQLGNHTWNHRGAATLEQADFEIGAVSKLIWKLQPDRSKLLVFASGGGGKKWGGRHWRDADKLYKQLVQKYHLIDLYDGTHPYISADTTTNANEMLEAIKPAIARQEHQAFTFHRIDRPATTLKGMARYILRRYDITFRKRDFLFFIRSLADLKKRMWIAPLLDVLKYETQYRAAELIPRKPQQARLTYDLRIGTDPDLFDHPLTLATNSKSFDSIVQIINGEKASVKGIKHDSGLIFHVKPSESRIAISIG
jgi:peptidoglycan/xylan/chitin deacetylase (PgdA/CDA1 family)